MWLTGEKDGIVSLVKTADDFYKLEEFVSFMKRKLDNVQLWAVKPGYDNVHFIANYGDSECLQELDFEEVLQEMLSADRGLYED